MFLETSAKTGHAVEEAFLKCSKNILAKIETGELDPERIGSGRSCSHRMLLPPYSFAHIGRKYVKKMQALTLINLYCSQEFSMVNLYCVELINCQLRDEHLTALIFALLVEPESLKLLQFILSNK